MWGEHALTVCVQQYSNQVAYDFSQQILATAVKLQSLVYYSLFVKGHSDEMYSSSVKNAQADGMAKHTISTRTLEMRKKARRKYLVTRTTSEETEHA